MAEKEVSIPELVALLTGDGYCLMIDEETKMEHYDEQGNLLVCTDTGEKWMAVPNVEVIRKLYNLPINEDTKDGILKMEIPTDKPISEGKGDSQMVWIGQRTQRSQEATKALIKLVDCPKYQKLMNDKSTIKVKVWEKIASELHEQGFKIANSVREAGLRTFQKWRNMERTYWKYLKNPAEFGEYKRKKKPSFFDDMHVVLSKHPKSLRRIDSNCSSEVDANEEDCDDISDALPLDAFRSSFSGLLSRDVIHMLVKLVNLKYYQVIKESDSSQQMKIWERIYEEITAAGLKISGTKRTGAIKLGLKWKSIERRHLNKINKTTPRKLYNPKLRKSLLIEMTKAKPVKIDEPMDLDDLNMEVRELKEGEIAPKAVEALLTLIDSDKYQELFNGGGRKARIWDKIYDDVEEMGFEIPGETKREKIQRLFQKWRNMKRTFIKYQMEKDIKKSRKKPLCYDLLLKIISKDIFRDSQDVEMISTLSRESNNCHIDFEDSDEQSGMAATSSVSGVSAPSAQAPTTSNRSSVDITDVLLQIKNLHEKALAVQQENLSKVVCLLEEQVREQKTLNTLFTQYVVNYSNKKNRSKSSSRSSPSNGFNVNHPNML